MAARELTGNPDCDDILGWLDAHSVSMAQGLPAHLLHLKWEQAGRPAHRLGACLQLLFEQDWIALTPGVDPPHLRFALEGYRRLLQPPAAPPQPPPATATPAVPAPEFIVEDDRVAPELTGQRYVRHGAPLTEIGLRNEVLAVYRDLRLKAQSRLIGVTLSRYWQESGLRAGDLRTALDVLTRDGFLRQRLEGMDRYWILTAEGERYLEAPLTPDALLRLAPPIAALLRTPEPEELRRLAVSGWAHRKLGAGHALGYDDLRSSWQRTGLDDNALLHGLDLLLKDGLAELASESPLRLTLSAAGSEYARRESAGISRLLSKLSRVLG